MNTLIKLLHNLIDGNQISVGYTSEDHAEVDGPLAKAVRPYAAALLRLEELDREIDAAPAWGAALGARLEERDGLARTLGLRLRLMPVDRLPQGTMMIQLPPGSRIDFARSEEAVLVTVRPEREPGEDFEPLPFPEPDAEGPRYDKE